MSRARKQEKRFLRAEKRRERRYLRQIRRKKRLYRTLSGEAHHVKRSIVDTLRKVKHSVEDLNEIRVSQGKKALVSAVAGNLKYALEREEIARLKKKPPRVIPNRILFETNDDFSDNGRALFDYMVEHHYQDRYEIIWLVNEPERYKQYEGKNIKFAHKVNPWTKKRGAEAFRYAMSAKYIFYSHAVNWVGSAQSEQLFIDLWHGCGYKGQNDSTRRIFFDYCLVPGELFIQTKKEFFHCSSKKILPIGYPRYDMMLRGSDRANAFAERLKAASGSSKLILWMPTYRHSTSQRLSEETLESDFNMPIIQKAADLVRLDKICRKLGVLVVIKRHYLQVPYDFGDSPLTNIVYLENADLAQENVQLYELIHASDALISDYSSVAIDYLLMDRPIGFTLDDYEAYSDSRGWVFEDPLKYMPGSHIYNMEDFEKFLQDIRSGNDPYRDWRAEVSAVAHNPTENYCQRILDYFNI